MVLRDHVTDGSWKEDNPVPPTTVSCDGIEYRIEEGDLKGDPCDVMVTVAVLWSYMCPRVCCYVCPCMCPRICLCNVMAIVAIPW